MHKSKTNQEDELELSDEQVARNDKIYNEVFNLCKVLSENSELEWNMSFIGEIADYAAAVLTEHAIPVRFPAIVTENDGSQYIEEYVKDYKSET